MNRRLVSATLSVLSTAAAGAQAAECVPKVENAWIRMPPSASMPMMAGFARISNPCAQEIVVTGAESLAFGDVSLHESREVDGVSRMREIEVLPIAAGKSVELKPGGLHLMLYRPESAFKEGEQPVITLKLKGGRSVPVTFTVRRSAP